MVIPSSLLFLRLHMDLRLNRGDIVDPSMDLVSSVIP
jgi:hypothetical protein